MPTTDFNLLIRDGRKLYVANPASHYADPTDPKRQPTLRPASQRDILMSLSAGSTEILDLLEKGGYNPEELRQVAGTLGFSEAEVAAYQGLEDRGGLNFLENYFRTELVSEMVNADIKHRGTVDDPAILKASEKQLPEWEKYYFEMAREIFDHMWEFEKAKGEQFKSNKDWLELYAGGKGFQRQAALLVQVQKRLGTLRTEMPVATPQA